MKLHIPIALAFCSMMLLNCGESEENSEKSVQKAPSVKDLIDHDSVPETYVTESYFQREEGYDWVSVTLTHLVDERIQVQVRSRADKKKPTCTVDEIGYMIDSVTYQMTLRNTAVILQFGSDHLLIDTKDTTNRDALYFNCSGGGSLYGTYIRLNENLAEDQLDKRLFTGFHSLQGITFRIEAFEDSTGNTLKIEPSGLEADNQTQKMTYRGNIETSLVEDLNSDGFPELIFILRDPKSHMASVIGYSVNNEKSMTPFYFAPPENSPKQYKGYNGYDRFELVETNLVQRFPIFAENGSRTDSIKQLTFELVEGEAMRQFKMKRENIFIK